MSSIGRSTPVNTYVEQPDGWADTWFAAVAAGLGWAAFIADSIGQGFYADDYLAHGWIGKLMALLKAKYGAQGEYAEYWQMGDSAFVVGSSLVGTAPPFVVGDTGHAVGIGTGLTGFGGVRWAGDAHPTASPNLVTITSPVACTAIELHWMNHYAAANSTWTYTVDAGAPVTVTNVASDNIQRKVTISGLSSGTHTVVITGQSADNCLVFMGASFYPNGTAGTGIGYVRDCLAGMKAWNAIQTGQVPSGGLQYQYLSGITNSSPNPFGFPTAPHLAVIELGVNDCQTQTISQMKYALTKIIDGIRQGRTNASILIVVASNPLPATSDVVTNTLANVDSWTYYAQALKDVARAKRCALIDFHNKWGSTPVGQGYLTSDGHAPHPSTAGHADMAASINNLI